MRYLSLILLALQLVNCSPNFADAIVLRQKNIKSRPGMYSSKLGAPKCGDYVCNNSETEFTCQSDCFTNAHSATLDKTNDFFECTDAWSADYTALSVSVWWKSPSTASAFKGIIGKSHASTEFLWQTDTNGTKMRLFVNSGSAFYVTTNVVFTTSTWYHIVWTFSGSAPDGTHSVLYVNGVAVPLSVGGGSPSTINSITDTSGTIEIATYNNSTSNVVGGTFDEVIIWKKTLTAADVTSIYNGGVPRNPHSQTTAAPFIWYTMGDAATDLFDSSSGSKLLVDIMGGANCVPTNTASGALDTLIPPN